LNKNSIIKFFGLTDTEVKKIDWFIEEIKKTNKITNLVGSSTLNNAWDRHICDSLQLSPLIKNKKSSILDMGTGAGLPGVALAILGYTNITMVDSKTKKISFVEHALNKLNLQAKTVNERLENIDLPYFSFITSRALAPLNRLINYSLVFSNKNTTLVFLKGRNVKSEIIEAKKKYFFNYKTQKSKSSGGGVIIIIKDFKKK
tara:strand:- start:659 stop:1264 length:606 start_codon:yes stop_codon:yes gene_type:complete